MPQNAECRLKIETWSERAASTDKKTRELEPDRVLTFLALTYLDLDLDLDLDGKRAPLLLHVTTA